MSERLVVPGETQLALTVNLSRSGTGGVTGKTITLEIRDGSSATSYFDFNDNTFKTSGWTTKTVNLTEVGATGRYFYVLNTSLAAAMVDGFMCEAEYKLASDTVNAFIASTTINFRANASGAPSAAAVADAVWDEAIAGHLTAGSTGAKLNATTNDPNGNGSVTVTEDYGGTNNLQAVTSGGVAVNDATVTAYLKSNWDAGNRSDAFRVAQTTTDVNGGFFLPLQLDPAVYTLYYFKDGFMSATKEVTVT